MELSGLALVTGAGQGIGRSIALRLLGAGATVMALGRNGGKLAGLSEEAGVPKDRVFEAECDIGNLSVLRQYLDSAENAHGPLRYHVAAAGILRPVSLLTSSEEDIREVIEINFTATLLALREVALRMIASGAGGSIVTIGSNSGTTPRMGLGSYPASKAGIGHATRSLGLELAQHGIRANVVAPGTTDTPMLASGATSYAAEPERLIKGDPDLWRLGIPLGRVAAPEDVADLTLFLLSDLARHITMETLVIDGGATLGAR